jgi:hypothetical protein
MVLLVEACKQTPTSESSLPAPQDVSGYLPLNLGNAWTYRTQSVNVLPTHRDTTLPRYQEERILYSLRDGDGSLLYAFTDDVTVTNPPGTPGVSGYYGYAEDALTLSYSPSGGFKLPLLKGPILVGTTWLSGGQEPDTLTIAAIDSGSFHGVPIDAVVLVVRHSTISADSSWYAHGIGLLRRRLTMGDGVPGEYIHVSWDLEDYTLH